MIKKLRISKKGALFALMIALMIAGCVKGIRFPKVYPLTVTVMNAGAPLGKMLVTMIPDEKIGNFSIMGETDASGVCKMKTVAAAQSRNGVPAGSYRVTVVYQGKNVPTKEEAEEFDRRTAGMPLDQVIAEEQKAKEERQRVVEEAQAVIPEEVRSLESTPITFKVPGEKTFDIELSDYAK